MIWKEIKDIKSGPKELRSFARVVGIACLIFAGLFWWRGKSSAPVFLAIGAALLLLGHTIPNTLKPLQKAWMSFAVVMGWFMTRLILSILFFLVVFPVAAIARLSGKKFLDRRFRDPKETSYWISKNEPKQKIDYERQF